MHSLRSPLASLSPPHTLVSFRPPRPLLIRRSEFSTDTRTKSTSNQRLEMSLDATSGPALYPLHRCKIIHLVRHAQGYHNVAGEVDRVAYLSNDYLDASLTPKGWKQVEALRKHAQSTGLADSVQLVVVSPLTRTLQTATGVFGGEEIGSGVAEKPLMTNGVGKAVHKAISSVGAPPFVAVEWCREHHGVHPCDKRQPVSTYKTLFPAVDFSDLQNDEDVLWRANHRESEEEIYARARTLVQWLLKRKEKEIAVVSHSSFLFHLMATFGDDCSSVVQDELHSLFANCELRTVVMTDRRASEAWTDGTTNFPGGIPDGGDAPSF